MKDIRMRGFHKRTSVDDAIKIILSKVEALSPERVCFRDSLNRVLAEDVSSSIDSPPFDRAAMDGYAVRAENTFGASQINPIYFKVIGEVTTGAKPDFEVGDFEAVKIMTGAHLPEGADSVVMFEYTEDMGSEIGVVKAVTPGKNVSLRGEDVKKEDIVLRKGRVIKPYDIALLASIGMTEVKVSKKPLVSIISTGDELKEPGENLLPGEVYNINTYVLSPLVEENGGIPKSIKIVKDDYGEIKKAVEDALNSDIIVLSGATSVGKKDVIPKVVEEMGKVLVHGVAMRPGEPTGFGVINNKPVFMLPGYPVASVFGFETFVIPAMQKMIGLPPYNIHPQVSGILSRKVASELGRRDFVRVRVSKNAGTVSVIPIRTSGSGIVSSITRADGFIVVPENTEGIEKGKKVTINLYRGIT